MRTLLVTNPFTEIQRFILSLSFDLDSKKPIPIKRKYQTPPADEKQLYQRQKASREERREIFDNDPRIDEFFSWLFSLMERSELNSVEFGKALGVSRQSIKMYRNYRTWGVFPRPKVIKRALDLEQSLRASSKRVKREFRIRSNGRTHKVSEQFLIK